LSGHWLLCNLWLKWGLLWGSDLVLCHGWLVLEGRCRKA